MVVTFAVAALSVSCRREEVPASSGMAVSFSAAENMDTKAAGMILSETFKSNGQTMGVFAYNTGHYRYEETSTNANFMYNEKVTYDEASDAWTYSPIKYWPNGEGTVTGNTGERPEYLSFFAYAPYSNPDVGVTKENRCITSFHLQEEPGNPWLIYELAEDPANQVDLLYATGQRNLTKPDVADKVSFVFHHALACVGEQVEVSFSELLKQEVDNLVTGDVTKAQLMLRSVYVTYHLTARARLNLYSTGYIARWEPILNGEQTTDRVVVYGPKNTYGIPEILYSTNPADATDAEASGHWLSDAEKGILYIPMDRIGNPQTFTVTVEYFFRVYSGPDFTDLPDRVRSSSTIQLSSYPGAFAPSRKLSKLTINLTIHNS